MGHILSYQEILENSVARKPNPDLSDCEFMNHKSASDKHCLPKNNKQR